MGETSADDVVRASAAGFTFAATAPTLSITKNSPRPWREKWRFTQHHLKRLSELYEGTTPGEYASTLDVEAWANGFFVECDHMRDWLGLDPSVLLSKEEIDQQIQCRYDNLQRCRDICNTHKHLERARGGRRPKKTARIAEIVTEPDGKHRVVIELDWLARTPSPDHSRPLVT